MLEQARSATVAPASTLPPVYTAEQCQARDAFKKRFFDMLVADTVDPEDNTVLSNGRARCCAKPC